MPRRKTIDTPEFNKHVYDCLSRLTMEQKLDLSTYQLSVVNSPSALKKWCEEQIIDVKLQWLVQLGFSWTLIMAPENADLTSVMSEVITQTSYAAKQTAIIETMQAKRMFVLSSRDVLVMTLMLAQNCHSSIWSMTEQHSNLSKKFKKLREVWGNEKTEVSMGKESMDDLVKMIYRTITTKDGVSGLCGVTYNEFIILLIMFPYRSVYIGPEEIEKIGDMARLENEKGIKKTLGNLAMKGYILREPGYNGKDRTNKNRKLSFTILEKGILAILKYTRYVMNNLPMD